MSEKRGYIYLLIAVGLWSTAEVVTRTIHDQISPLQFAWVRFCIASLLLVWVLPLDLHRKKLHLTKTVVLQAIFLSLLGIVLTAITYQYALTYAGASVVATIYGCMPIMVFLLSWLVLGDLLTIERSIGVCMGFVGLFILAQSKESDTFSLIGVLIMVFNVFCFSLFSVLVKRYVGVYAGTPFTVLCFIFGAIWMTPLALLEGDTRGLENIAHIWPAVLYVGIFTTGLAFLLYFLGLERVDATGASSIILLKPPLAVLLAALALGEPLTWNLGLSLICIMGGLCLVNIVHYRRIQQVKNQLQQSEKSKS